VLVKLVQGVHKCKEVNDALHIYMDVILGYTQRWSTISHGSWGNTWGL